jgi:LemA protein
MLSTAMVALYIILGFVALGVIWVVVTYNSMVSGRNKVEESWSGIDVQLKRRHDLVPNLVETVKGYATHEQKVFQDVTEARAQAMAASGPHESGPAESHLSAALGGIRAVAEQYPDLRATENFQQLQRELTEIEDEIQASRRIYNSNVQIFNTRIQVFPNSVIASRASFTPREFFEIELPQEREVPRVAFT